MKKFFIYIASLVFLNGCVTPMIENKIDEMTGKNVCRLKNFEIKKFYGGNVVLFLEKEQDHFRTVIQINSVRGNNVFLYNPNIDLEVISNDQKTDQFRRTAQVIDIKQWSDPIYYNGIVIGHVRRDNIVSIIPFTKADLSKILASTEVNFTIGYPSDYLSGYLNSNDIEQIKNFSQVCLK